MSTPFWRAPHEGPTPPGAHAPNAALLIDFDNVTMGMRSDLAKELKVLLQSEVIRGKVTVQRAYADWRRYPQYIVPLSEASIDLIFAPAYGSSKKNATDIRMAIDGMELVFIRPEIGTFILLTGDSDFSSLVLKLKEYGKYVIGIGIQESSSDILVQNCDEYYSYTSISGLRKTTDLDHSPLDPWTTVEQALQRMVGRSDVMRSDRLKQVMLEIDPGFDEKGYGFSKFSKFLAEASSRNLINLKKLENGQYEVHPPRGSSGDRSGGKSQRKSDGRRGRKDRDDRKDREERRPQKTAAEPPASSSEGGDPLAEAYALLQNALRGFDGAGREPVRDSDVKRKILDLEPGFDEAELGFSKFSRFLQQAHDQSVIVLTRRETGNYEVSLGTGGPGPSEAHADGVPSAAPDAATPSEPAEAPPASEARGVDAPPESQRAGRTLGARRGSQGSRRGGDAPTLFEGQVADAGSSGSSVPRDGGEGGRTDLRGMGLPTDPGAIVRYLTSRYKGVGEKTAEALVEAFGAELFSVCQDAPERLSDVVPAGRAQQLLAAWASDYERRSGRAASNGGGGGESEAGSAAGTGSARRGMRRSTRRGAARRKDPGA